MDASTLPLLVVAVACLALGFVLGRVGTRRDSPAELATALAPVSAALQSLDGRIREAEREQASAQAALRTTLSTQLTEQVHALIRSTDDVRREAAHLRAVLGRTGARGQWGEMQLRRLVESAGLLDRVHFDEQATQRSDDGRLRPDMVIHLSGDRHLVVDAKVPLAAFLAADQASEDALAAALSQHATDVMRHVDALHAKGYRDAVDGTADFVVMFLPSESLLEAALQQRPDLLDYAFARDVIPATPTTLFALLRTIGLGWREERLAQHAEEISRLGRELHSRLATLAGHVTRLGSALTSAVTHYNKAVGSLETRVLVTARAFEDLGVTPDHLPEVPTVTEAARIVSAAELLVGPEPVDIRESADAPR